MTSAPAPAGVAIIGMACRFPGAADHRAFWSNLCEGVESISRLADADLLAAGAPMEALRDPAYVRAAPLLQDADRFDAGFFEYSPHEARVMDPQQRLLLEVAWEAFEDAGQRPGPAKPVGVFVGTGGVVSSYLVDRLQSSADLRGATGSLAHIGNDKDFASTRISYKLNLTGPSINVQTACSTSLVAVHLACQAILAGECDMALAGAATVRVPQHAGYVSQTGGILSPDGHCRAFDAEAAGTIFGSGVGAVLLKDVAAALADGDHIYAVIRGSAINNDGADKVSYTASSVAGQARAMVEAMSVAEISPDHIGYVECHGTGTIVGDPLEIDALSRAFRTATDRCGYCAIGSVKTNIGHLEQTAGVAALIKAALALAHQKIPASLNFRTPNPKIDFAASPFFVNERCSDWLANGHARVAAVNSLGLGGTNAFVVLEEAPQSEAIAAAAHAPAHLFTLSAQTDAALHGSIERYCAWLADAPAPLPDICFTLTQGRTHFPRRFSAVASSVAELRDALAEGAGREEPSTAPGERKLAFLFSGQASQYAGMGAELYRSEPAFRRIIDRCDDILRNELERPLKQVLFGDGDASAAIDQTVYTQPALFATQAALVELWRAWGIAPDMVMGHSVGEFAAAYCAGVYSLEEALRLVAVRARLMQTLPPNGTMASIFADEATVATAIARFDAATLAIAGVNAPQSTVISGARDSVRAAVEYFESLGIQCRQLTVSHAFHSPLMEPARDELGRLAASAAGRAPRTAWVSTLSGARMSEAPDAPYWQKHAREPVRFMQGLATLRAMGATDFVEIGPGHALQALGRQCCPEDGLAWLGSLDLRGERRRMLETLGELYRRGATVDWDGFNTPQRGRRISLPTYAFERRRFWIDGETTAPTPASDAAPGASLTGLRLRSPLPDIQFESAYSLARFGWLDDHRIYGMPVLPFTAGLVALQQAARQHFGTDAVEIDNAQYREAMILPEAGQRTVQSILVPTDTDSADCRLVSTGDDAGEAWRTHMIGMVRKASAPPPAIISLEQISDRCSTVIPAERYYAAVHALGLHYGPSFRGIGMLRRGDGEVCARVHLPATLTIDDAPSLHPALLDACLHVYPALVEAYGDFSQPPTETRRTFLPISIEQFRSAGAPARDVWVHATRRAGSADQEILTIDIAIYRDDGSFAASIAGLALKQLSPQELSPHPALARIDWLYQLRWQEQPALATAATASGRASGWLIMADRGGVGDALADMLTRRGDTCHIMRLDDFLASPIEPDESGDLLARVSAELARLAETTSPPLRGVIDLWPLDVKTDTPTLDDLATGQKIAVGAGAAIFRTIAEAPGRADAATKVWLITRNAVAASPDDDAAEPARASVWGLGRSASLEHPQFWGGLVDLEGSSDRSPSHDAAALLAEITHGDGEDQVALRAGRRFTARLARMPALAPNEAKFDPDGIYLITGGLGALGLKVAEWLADRHGVKHIALSSRRGDSDPVAAETRRTFAARGVEIEILTADVTDAQDLADAIAQLRRSSRAIKGVFHCAGLLDDGILLQMDWQKFHRVMAPKVEGAWLLHQLTRDLALDHFVLFSSILSLIGSAGQANYAAANAFLDALAARRRREGLPALALNWGPWAETGLATASGDKGRQIWRARGTAYIDADTGRQALDALIGSDVSHGAITLTQWPTFIEQFATVPPLYRDLQREVAGAAPATPVDSHAEHLRAKLKEASADERRELLIAFVGRLAQKTLGMSDPVPATRPLREFGLDSLMSVTLVNRIEAALGIRISAAKLIRGPSVQELVDDLVPLLAPDGAPAAESPHVAAPHDDASRWLVVVGPRAAPRLRLFCFPFAGGGSAIYRNWARALDPGIEVIAIEPPGRLSRIKETPVCDMDEFVDRLAAEMQGVLDRPFAFFGHCLGALTMYETARRLIHSTEFRPTHLFASGARPPDRVADQSSFEERLTQDLMNLAEFRISLPAWLQPDDVFAQIIRHFNIQASEQLLSDPQLRELMLPVIRAEFQMAVNYRFPGEQPWDIPITCFAARGDPYVSRRHALGWGRFTNSRLQVFIRDGTHFAVVDDVDFIHGVINRELRA